MAGLVRTALGSLEVFWAERGIRVITTITQACQQRPAVTNHRSVLRVLTNQNSGESLFWRRDALTGPGQNHNFKPLMFMTARPIFCFWIHNLGIFIRVMLHNISQTWLRNRNMVLVDMEGEGGAVCEMFYGDNLHDGWWSLVFRIKCRLGVRIFLVG